MAFVDQRDTGDQPAQAAADQGIQLEVVKPAEAKKGFVLLPRVGSSSAVSPGRLVFAASHGITNDCRKPSQAFIFSLS